MASARENDLNPDIFIGLKLPFNRDKSGLFGRTQTTLEQAGSNIKNLLLTAKGERVMQPDFGSRLRELLFEQYTEDLSSRIQSEIQEAISTWLPYINISSVNIIQSDEDPNTTSVDIDFSLNYEPDKFESITLNLGGDSESTSTSGGGGY
jgi:phage baseplate assembly protein W